MESCYYKRVSYSLKERSGGSCSKNVLDHEGKAVSSHDDLFLNGGDGSSLVLACEGNVGLHTVVDGALGNFETLSGPHTNIDVLPLVVSNRVSFYELGNLSSEGLPIRGIEWL